MPVRQNGSVFRGGFVLIGDKPLLVIGKLMMAKWVRLVIFMFSRAVDPG
jgi:hypothetical protein